MLSLLVHAPRQMPDSVSELYGQRLYIQGSAEKPDGFIRLTRIGELRTTQAVTSNRRTLRRNTKLLVTASVVLCSQILVTLMKEALSPPNRRFLQEPHGVTSQKTPFVKCCWALPAMSLPDPYLTVSFETGFPLCRLLRLAGLRWRHSR
jgi:hypothetical protein